MARTALVTGGSRGIGEAISKALKAEGYNVAATYAGNDEKAAAFTDATGIKTYKWNVADYEASKAGIAKVEEELGPIDIVVDGDVESGVREDRRQLRSGLREGVPRIGVVTAAAGDERFHGCLLADDDGRGFPIVRRCSGA